MKGLYLATIAVVFAAAAPALGQPAAAPEDPHRAAERVFHDLVEEAPTYFRRQSSAYGASPPESRVVSGRTRPRASDAEGACELETYTIIALPERAGGEAPAPDEAATATIRRLEVERKYYLLSAARGVDYAKRDQACAALTGQWGARFGGELTNDFFPAPDAWTAIAAGKVVDRLAEDAKAPLGPGSLLSHCEAKTCPAPRERAKLFRRDAITLVMAPGSCGQERECLWISLIPHGDPDAPWWRINVEMDLHGQIKRLTLSPSPKLYVD